MTATAAATTSPRWRSRFSRSSTSKDTSVSGATPDTDAPAADTDIPPLSPGLQLARAALIMVVVMVVTVLLQLTVIGGLQQSSAQERKFDEFRSQLATGTAPIGPTDNQNRALTIGDPVAYVEIPEIGLRQVVVEGTTSSALFSGPGHRRDTVLPGQVGATIIMGRAAAFGGPRLREGQRNDVVLLHLDHLHGQQLGVRRSAGRSGADDEQLRPRDGHSNGELHPRRVGSGNVELRGHDHR